ncbi:9119_t:CDS:2 [Cetraspora pellucida]|uniref:9119_t:CDS:1 n=1 Tax=Cetraspora pellucida TaxID=1433469 RepID=A0A9N9EV28_9GLOM|nr:9119_t:CDS:2 [Cetraspora pellucida]
MANKEWQKCRKESKIKIKKLINQYLAASSPIIRIANFFLPPNLPNSRSSNSNPNINFNTNSSTNPLPSSSRENSRKEKKQLEDEIVEIYDTRRCLSELQKNPDLLNQIHECVEFGAADKKRRKTVIKMKPHIDEHYCLASVKSVRVFASTFANFSIIISQDDKAKVGLVKQKLIPSVYLIINPKNTNESLHQGQLSIYICLEYFVETSLITHMKDLLDITKHNKYAKILKHDEHLKSIWILLVDGGPDENPKHLKNIIKYCCFFYELNLDYLSVRMHALYQSVYNPVEHSMYMLSEKLARIKLSVDRFGSYLNSQGVVIDKDLARHNFEFAGKCLYEIWKRDKIYEKQVYVDYVNYNENLFQNNGKEIPS